MNIISASKGEREEKEKTRKRDIKKMNGKRKNLLFF